MRKNPYKLTLSINEDLTKTFRQKLNNESNKSVSEFITEVMESYLFDYVEYTGALDAYIKCYTDSTKHTENKLEKILKNINK